MSTSTIERRAIDPSGTLSSFYNGCEDYILTQTITVSNEPMSQLYESARCELYNGKANESENLLKMMGIDDDLRLSILLKSKLQTGIAELVNYPDTVDTYTRFLYFHYADREQRFPDDSTEIKTIAKSRMRDAEATHVITAISFGIDVIVVLQLPRNENTVEAIDVALNKIRRQLKNSTSASNFTTDDENALEKIIETKAYSNVIELTKMTSLLKIYHFIKNPKKSSDTYRPLAYILQPISWLYSEQADSCTRYTKIEKDAGENLEHRLIKLSKSIKRLENRFSFHVNSPHREHFQEQFSNLESQWSKLQKLYKDVINRWRDLVSHIHSGEKNASDIKQALEHEDLKTLNGNIREMTTLINDLEKQADLFNSSQPQQQQNEYSTSVESNVPQSSDKQRVLRRNISENQQDQTSNSDKKRTKNDQSTSSIEYNQEKRSASSSSSQTKTSTTTSSSKADDIINILLLGESGVGKSTFINAFVNYLEFKAFEQAESNKPVVLIPVSFVITTGNNFEEHTIKFGDPDSLNNEDFDHPGQSVTQHCKSYVFNLSGTNGSKKLRIIDTPGFGDTRGIDQDDLNIQHILEYITNLTHLNAVCFLLKPNTSQINNFFQTCLTQLLDLLGTNICQNIIFCFTNARSTFYSPGDTAPLLKDILKSPSLDKIQFVKKNTFCFDNESFRYLIALQKEITFDDEDKKEYEMSWSKSVDESKRLYNYIDEDLMAFKTCGEQQSIKDAQFKINHMIRPMLEAMRNIQRNIILMSMDPPEKLIELVPKTLHRPASVCFTCPRRFVEKKNFLIAYQDSHEMQKECYSCSCPISQHMTIDYELWYENSEKSSNSNCKEMEKELDQLFRASFKFAHFLMNVAHSTKQDPFLIGITQMIAEENDISKRQASYENTILAQKLTEILHEYDAKIDNIDPNSKYNKLSTIYNMIRSVCDHPTVQIQMVAVRKTQEELMKLYEYRVPENNHS